MLEVLCLTYFHSPRLPFITSPLPREIWKAGDDVIPHLYMCEFTLNFYKTKGEIDRHYKRNTVRHPPGDEIYRNNNISVFEVDGEKAKVKKPRNSKHKMSCQCCSPASL